MYNYNENGNKVSDVTIAAGTGYRTEYTYYANGNTATYYTQYATGECRRTYYENGQLKTSRDVNNGDINEVEYDANGKTIRSKFTARDGKWALYDGNGNMIANNYS